MKPRTETELKYDVLQAGVADRYLEMTVMAGFFASDDERTKSVEDRYVDTPELALARAGWAARFRSDGETTQIDLKSRERMTGLHRRRELEGPADASAPPADWPASAARDLVVESCGGDGRLETLVTLRQVRRTRRLRNDRAEVELSLDVVDVEADGRSVDRFEALEVELVSGRESELEPIAAVFDGDPWLCQASQSKLERAIGALMRGEGGETASDRIRAIAALFAEEGEEGEGPEEGEEHEQPAAAEAKPEGRRKKQAAERRRAGERRHGGRRRNGAEEPPTAGERAAGQEGTQDTDVASDGGDIEALDAPAEQRTDVAPADHRKSEVAATETLAAAGSAILRVQLGRVAGHEKGVRSGTDPEDVHQMRVATRRARAALRLFGDAFDDEKTRRLERGLRGLARRLGAVRDLDVLLEALDGYAATLEPGDAAGLEPVRTAWRRDREKAHAALIDELDSDSYRRLSKAADRFVREPALAGRGSTRMVRDRAGSALFEAYERVQAFEPILPWADIETLHDVRIAAKWLRYTIEFFRAPLGDEAGELIARVTRLQDHLGVLHDADVAASLARRILVDTDHPLEPVETRAIGAYLRSREREIARLRRSSRTVYRGVAGPTFRRSLARALGRL